MKKLICFCMCFAIFFLNTRAFDFEEFYSAFSSSKLILPDRLVIKCAPGEEQVIKIATRPRELTGISWVSSDERIATIKETEPYSATVSPHAAGECVITITHVSSKTSAQVKLYVSERRAHISLSSNALTLKSGQSALIYAQTDGDTPPAWTSDDTDVLTLSGGDNVCRIYAKKGGDTLVHASVPGAEATVNVHVEKNRTGIGIKVVSLILILLSLSLLIGAYFIKT